MSILIRNNHCMYEHEFSDADIKMILYLIEKEIKITNNKSCTKYDLKILYKKLESIIKAHWEF